jgi:hypothetical protein
MTATRLGPLVAALALSAVFLATGTARADVTRGFAVGVDSCQGAGVTQFCTPVPLVALPTDSMLLAEFVASTTHCSNIVAHLLVDGVERYQSVSLAPGQSTGGVDFGPVAAGVHKVAVQAEGVIGGCNSGSLASWRGTLTLTVSGVAGVDAAIAAPGVSVSVSTFVGGAPPTPAAVGASYTRPVSALGLTTLSAATYIPPNPVLPIVPIGSVAFVDLLFLGGDDESDHPAESGHPTESGHSW